jgi:restriction endonuclease
VPGVASVGVDSPGRGEAPPQARFGAAVTAARAGHVEPVAVAENASAGGYELRRFEDDVQFYIKLSPWFAIDTPVGMCNPDWALAYRNESVLYFVAETKAAGASQDQTRAVLRLIEGMKIECGKRHFRNFERVQFKAVASLAELSATASGR